MTPAQITAWRRLAHAVAKAGRADTLDLRERAAQLIARRLKTTWRWRLALSSPLLVMRGLGEGYLAMDRELRMANREALSDAARKALAELRRLEAAAEGEAAEGQAKPLRPYRADIDG